MVKIVFMEEYQEKYDNIKKWYVQQGVSNQSIQNIKADIKNTVDVIISSPNSYSVLESRPYLHYATTHKYKFNIYYIFYKDFILFKDIKAGKQDGLYETINDEINEILEIAGVKN